MPRRTLYKKRNWDKVKSLINDKKGHALDFEEKQNGVFRVFVTKGRTEFFVNLYPPGFGHVVGISETNDADYQEFIDTYQTPIEDTPPADVEHVLNSTTGEAVPKWSEPHTGDGKVRILSSHKPVIAGKESFNFFTSKGDHAVSGTLSEGGAIMIQTVSGEEYTYSDLKFSNMVNPNESVYAFGGSFGWENAGWGDCFSFEIWGRGTPVVPRVVATGIGLAVDYKLDDDKIYYAGPDVGDYALGDYPTWIPTFDKKDGHWNLDKQNLVPIPVASGTGDYNWNTGDVHIGSYISDVLVYKDSGNLLTIDATEAAPLAYGHWFRVLAHNNSNTEWKLWGFLKMYRERLR